MKNICKCKAFPFAMQNISLSSTGTFAERCMLRLYWLAGVGQLDNFLFHVISYRRYRRYLFTNDSDRHIFLCLPSLKTWFSCVVQETAATSLRVGSVVYTSLPKYDDKEKN